MDHREFLTAVFGTKRVDDYILLWTLGTKRSSWFQDVNAAASFIEQAGNDINIYVGTGLSAKDMGSGKRCVAKEISGLPGFYCDIDIKGDAHKKDLLPATLDEALSIVKGHGFDPTIVVHSGNGIQAWWLFHDVINFETKAERDQAAKLSWRLGQELRIRGERRGWKVDSVFDLARVLRIPETWNIKNGNKKRATVLEENTQRYSILDFDSLLPSEEELCNALSGPESTCSANAAIPQEFKDVVAGNVVISAATAEPPIMFMESLLEVDPKFKATWDNKRPDLPSTSEYHLSLANFAAHAGWNEQQIVDLIIAWQRRHGHPMNKVMRQKYMIDTVAMAVKGAEQRRNLDAINTAAAAEGTAFKSDDCREEAKTGLCKLLGLNITEIVKYEEDKSKYYMAAGNEEKYIGDIDAFESRVRIKRTVSEFTNMPCDIAKKDWPVISQYLYTLIRVESATDESTEKGRTWTWINDYLDASATLDMEDAYHGSKPFLHTDGHWHLNIDVLRQWVMRRGEHVTRKDLSRSMRQLGCATSRLNVIPSGESNTFKIRVWRIPVKIYNRGPRVIKGGKAKI